MSQREYPRVDFEAEASIINGVKSFKGRLENISLCGVYIRTESRIPVGASAEVTFADTFSSRKGAVKANGKVVRTDGEGIAFRLQQMDVDSFINLHLMVSRRAASA